MKKLLLTFVLLVGIVFGLFAQKLTYQAVIRDNNQQLVVNTAVKATVTIDFTTGNDPTWTVDDTTNLHGLLSIEFGDATLNGRDWTGATIAVKVVNAATPSIVYVNGDARPVSAVPYALSVNGQSIQNYLTEHNYVDLDKLNDTLNAYSTTAAMDARHYLTSDSAVIKTMQGNITTNANSIANLTLHTAKNAIRDSVAGQIHDSISNIAAKAHTHDNMAILNATEAPYTDADSAKLHDIAAGAEVNVQSDWKQAATDADDFIKNKPSITDTVNGILTTGKYVTETTLDGRHYLTSDSAVITAMQNNLQQLSSKLDVQIAKLDSIAHIVDSLAKLPHGSPEVVYGQPCPGAETVTDAQENTYPTVKIGNQCWMAKNLRTTTSIGNTNYPNKDEGYVSDYGLLYDWAAVMQNGPSSDSSPSGVQGICPNGWHVPSNLEWVELTTYVKNVEAFQCDSDVNNIANALSAATGWSDDSPSCCPGYNSPTLNKTGFAAVPAGDTYHGQAELFGTQASFWSTSQVNDSSAYQNYLDKNSTTGVLSAQCNKVACFSVRCLKN